MIENGYNMFKCDLAQMGFTPVGPFQLPRWLGLFYWSRNAENLPVWRYVGT